METQDLEFFEVLKELVGRLNAGVYRNTPGEKGIFLYWNEAVEKMFGYTASELRHLPVSKLYPTPEDRHEFENEILAAGYVRRKQLHLINKKGESIYVEITAIVSVDSKTNKVSHYDGIVLDVTDEVEMYENISHQISTPVLGIMHSAQRLIERGVSDTKSPLFLKSILGCSRLALFLTRNLSYMSRIMDMSSEAFRRILLPMSIAPQLIKFIIDIQEYALEKDIHINADSNLLDSLPKIRMDETSFMMAAFCIFDNAIKYSFEKTTITVAGSTSGQYVSIFVQNEGIPLKKEHLPPSYPNVFTKKYRTPEAKAFVAAGAGLGLYFARRIMQLHGGEIFVEPSKGYITIFRLAFPLSSANLGDLK